jgi:hypothetical protein
MGRNVKLKVVAFKTHTHTHTHIYMVQKYHIDNNNNFLCVNGYTYHVMELLVYKTCQSPLKHLCDLGTSFYRLLESSKKKLG